MTLTSVQALRAVAVLFVAMFHLNMIEADGIVRGGGTEAPLVGGLWGNGFAGVDLFFVISGFIMVHVTQGVAPTLASARAFLFARFARIYPLWWLFASVMVAYFWVTYGTLVDEANLAAHGQSAAGHLVASYLLWPQPSFPVLSVGWTLVHEMYFYLVFAVILLLPRSALLWALLGWGGLVAVGSALGLSHTVAQTLLQLVTHAMTVEFILGALVGLAVQSGKPWRPGLVACLGAVWFAAAMVFTPVAETWPQLGEFGDFMMQWGRVVLYGVPAALVVYGLVCLEAAGRFREVRPLTVLGDWSYALYLSHILVASGIKQMLPRAADLGEAQLGLPAPLAEGLRLGSAGLADNVVFTVLALGAMIAFAGLVHHVIERPLARGVRQLRQRQQAEAAKPKAVILPPG